MYFLFGSGDLKKSTHPGRKLASFQENTWQNGNDVEKDSTE